MSFMSYRDATKRNRNIGKKNHGVKNDNRFTIPFSADCFSSHVEQLKSHAVHERLICGQTYRFIVEETYVGSQHACSIEDIVTLISLLPKSEMQGMETFILRQPTRKEELLAPVWGRFVPAFRYRGESFPAIVLEAIDYSREIVWPRHLRTEDIDELERLRKEGHYIEETKRHFVLKPTVQTVRTTQLFRTLLHELGHYQQYLTAHFLAGDQREKGAHLYAQRLIRRLEDDFGVQLAVLKIVSPHSFKTVTKGRGVLEK